jgi:putative nucleotidyltransferase with HDIG domain
MSQRVRTSIDPNRFRPAPKPTRKGVATSGFAPGDFSIAAREHRVREIASRVETLPSLPSILMEVLELANDAETKASDFEEIIRKDQALVAKVLKLVNSPFFGLRHKVSSISQAIVILGFKSLKSVVIAAKSSKLLDRQLHAYGFGPSGMWKHSMSCATICRMLAVRLGLSTEDQEELFVGGLLHDVGKILLAPYIENFQAEFNVRVAGTDLSSAERETVGIAHDDVGGRMADQWGLAPSLAMLIRSHHAPNPSESERSLLTLQLANEFCGQLGVGRVDGPMEPSASYGKLLDRLHLAESRDEIEATVRLQIEQLQETFEALAGGND